MSDQVELQSREIEEESIIVHEKTIPIEWPSEPHSLLNTSAASDDTLIDRRASINSAPNTQCASMPDLSRVGPNRSRNNSGSMTPVRPLSLREYEQQLSDLKKENFNLKLRIYFLESKLPKLQGLQGEDLCKVVLELQCQLEVSEKELETKNDQLSRVQTNFDKIQRFSKRDLEEKEQEIEEIRVKYEKRLGETEKMLCELRQLYYGASKRVAELEVENQNFQTLFGAGDGEGIGVPLQGITETTENVALLEEREKQMADLKTEMAKNQFNFDHEKNGFIEQIENLRSQIEAEKLERLSLVGAGLSKAEMTGIEVGSLVVAPETQEMIEQLENKLSQSMQSLSLLQQEKQILEQQLNELRVANVSHEGCEHEIASLKEHHEKTKSELLKAEKTIQGLLKVVHGQKSKLSVLSSMPAGDTRLAPKPTETANTFAIESQSEIESGIMHVGDNTSLFGQVSAISQPEGQQARPSLQSLMVDPSLNQTSLCDLTVHLEALAAENEHLRQLLSSMDLGVNPPIDAEITKLREFVTQSSNLNGILRERLHRLVGETGSDPSLLMRLQQLDMSQSMMNSPGLGLRQSQCMTDIPGFGFGRQMNLSMSARSFIQFEPKDPLVQEQLEEARRGLDAALSRIREFEDKCSQLEIELLEAKKRPETNEIEANTTQDFNKMETALLRCSDLEQQLAEAVKKPEMVTVQLGTEETMVTLENTQEKLKEIEQKYEVLMKGTEETMVTLENTQYKVTETEHKHHALMKEYEVLESEKEKLTGRYSKLEQHARSVQNRLRQFEQNEPLVQEELGETRKGLDTAFGRIREFEERCGQLEIELVEAKKRPETAEIETNTTLDWNKMQTALLKCSELELKLADAVRKPEMVTVQLGTNETMVTLENTQKKLYEIEREYQLLHSEWQKLTSRCSKLEQDLSFCEQQKDALLKNLGVMQAERETVAIRCSKLEQLLVEAVNKPKTASVKVGTEETMVTLENTQYKLTETEHRHQSLMREYDVLKSEKEKVIARNSKLEQHARNVKSRLRQFESDIKADASPVAAETSSTLIRLDEVLRGERGKNDKLEDIIKQLEANNMELERRIENSEEMSTKERQWLESRKLELEEECSNLKETVKRLAVDTAKENKYREKVKEMKGEMQKVLDENLQMHQMLRKKEKKESIMKTSRSASASSTEVEQKGSLPEADMPTPPSRDTGNDSNRSKRHRLKREIQEALKHAKELTGLVKEFKKMKNVSSDEWRQIQNYVGELRYGMEFVVQLTTGENDSGAVGGTSNNDNQIREMEYLRNEVDRLREQIKSSDELVTTTQQRLTTGGEDTSKIVRELAKIRVVLQQKNRQDALMNEKRCRSDTDH